MEGRKVGFDPCFTESNQIEERECFHVVLSIPFSGFFSFFFFSFSMIVTQTVFPEEMHQRERCHRQADLNAK
jgi:hypothetical protein